MTEESGALRKLRNDLAAALAVAGDRQEAEHVLSADLTPAQIEQSLNAYAAARKLSRPEQGSAGDPRTTEKGRQGIAAQKTMNRP
jgi:hypothetical protein